MYYSVTLFNRSEVRFPRRVIGQTAALPISESLTSKVIALIIAHPQITTENNLKGLKVVLFLKVSV